MRCIKFFTEKRLNRIYKKTIKKRKRKDEITKNYINDIKSRMLQNAYEGLGRIELNKRDAPEGVNFDYVVDYFSKKNFCVRIKNPYILIFWDWNFI